MPDPYRVQPDSDFVRRIVEDGGGDLKKCFQCATCSMVCGLSNGDRPFPRKEMIWAQWGLRDRLMADPDVWICHQCGDCSTQCPRGARPGDVLAAIRREAIFHYAVPASLARWVNDPARLLPVPVWALQAAGALLGKSDAVQRLCSNLQVDISKARQLLGWVPPVSLEEGLKMTMKVKP